MNEELFFATGKVPIGSTWQHYKGGVYVVRGYTFGTDEGELLIRYQRVGGPGFVAIEESYIEYARPLTEWFNILMANTKRFRLITTASQVRTVDAPVRD